MDNGNISQQYRGIAVTLDEFESAIYTLASHLKEDDWDELATLIEQAKTSLTRGSDRMPSLVSALASKQLTGSYIAGRDALDAAYAVSGRIVRRWEYNVFPGPHYPLLGKVHITAGLVSRGDEPDVYALQVGWDKDSYRKPSLEAMLAEALGVDRILDRAYVTFPVEVFDRYYYRYDLAPFITGLAALGLGPFEYMEGPMTVETALEWFDRKFGNKQRDHYSINTMDWYLLTPNHPGLAVSLATYGTGYTTCRGWGPHEVVYDREGTVFTGQISELIPGEPKLDEPVIQVAINRPHAKEGSPVWPTMYNDALKAPMLDLATSVSTMLPH